jgi:hypothetical protein
MDSSKRDHQTTDPPSSPQSAPIPNSTSPSYGTSLVTSRVNEKTGVYEHSNELESQSTTEDGINKEEAHELEAEPSEDSPERPGDKLARVRSSTWWFVGALLIAIPMSIFATVLSTVNISGIRVTGVIIWLEITWTAGWLIYFLVRLVGKTWEGFSVKHGLEAWDEILSDTSISQLWFFLSLAAWGSSWIMCHFTNGNCNVHWIRMLRKVLLATLRALCTYQCCCPISIK